jgi:hypothetical protein
MTKPNCYNCIHRGEVIGSCHSSCQHPAARTVASDPIAALAGLLGKRSGLASIPLTQEAQTLNVRGAALGVRNGWFLWPVNFDPVWLEQCNGFTAKGESQ